MPSEPVTSTPIDPTKAREAYDALSDVLRALRDDELIAPRVDAQLAAIHAYSVAERDRRPERAAEFHKLVAASTFAADPTGRLAQLALATWYAKQQHNRALTKGRGAVPSPIAATADERKRRMLKLVAHFFEDHPGYGAEVAAIRAGNGHVDAANDLQQLADLYEIPEVARVIASDPIHYRDTDPRDARATAGEIFRALGYEDGEAADWADRVRRAYTLLERAYTQHCDAGTLLFRRREDVAVTYPCSLVSVVRTPRGRTQPAVVTDPLGGPPPAET